MPGRRQAIELLGLRPGERVLLPEYRGSGGTAILFNEMFKSVTENPRYHHADIVQIGVENENMQREMQRFGIDFYKRHRVYEREI